MHYDVCDVMSSALIMKLYYKNKTKFKKYDIANLPSIQNALLVLIITVKQRLIFKKVFNKNRINHICQTGDQLAGATVNRGRHSVEINGRPNFQSNFESSCV